MLKASRLAEVRGFIGGLYGPDLDAKRIYALAGATLGVMTGASLAVAMIGHASSTLVRYRKPAVVGTWVMSATQIWFGRDALKHLSTRSEADQASWLRRVAVVLPYR
jgi:hypothetical protein